MTREKKETSATHDRARKVRWPVIVALILLLLLLLLLWWRRSPRSARAVQGKEPVAETMAPADTHTVFSDTETVAGPDTTPAVAPEPSPVKSVKQIRTALLPETPAVATADSAVIDSTQLPDTLAADTAGVRNDECAKDTTELWVYPDPSGGLHYRAAQVKFMMNRKAAIHYQFKGETGWKKYDGTAFDIATTTTLYFDAIDSCGKVMERRAEYYEIESRSKSPCPAGMEQVKVGSMNYCIDKYEWPNRRGVIPKAYISQYQAADSCFSAAKRLCTAEEWMVACAGPYTWKYPYGQAYERYGCVTHDSMPQPSGSKAECRSFFGAFDMSGNLLEWTSTRAAENQAFTYVTGGFWESGPKSGCRDKRYSYYPQNQHNPVGFRCCRDLVAPAGGKP